MAITGYLPSFITDRLYLGSATDANNREGLKTIGITHVVKVVPFQFPEHPDDFKYHVIPIFDNSTADLKPYFTAVFSFIETGIKQGGVLVHCGAGISRAPTVVIGYLMHRNKWRLKDAEEYVRLKRFIIEPNDGFIKQLEVLEKEIFGE